MSGRSRTDDDIGLKPRRTWLTQEKRVWIGNVLGVDLDSLVALDLQSTTSQPSVDLAVPTLLRQVTEIAGPLKDLPSAQTTELSAAMLSITGIRNELGGKPTPQTIVTVRRQVDALPDLVKAAVESVTRLQQSQRELIEKARQLTYSKDAAKDSEGDLIKTFETEQAAVAGAFKDGPLSGKQVDTAEIAFKAADTAAKEIDKAVEERHAKWAESIRERADKLMKGFTQDLDPALWATPKATREQIDKELVSS